MEQAERNSRAVADREREQVLRDILKRHGNPVILRRFKYREEKT